MIQRFVVAFFLSVCMFGAVAQPTTDIGPQTNETNLDALQAYEDSLFNIAASIKDKLLFQDRLIACYDFIPVFVNSLKEPGSFDYDFPNLDFISTVYAPDSTFRIMTWLVKVDESSHRYFGTLQMNDEELKMYPFFDIAEPIENLWNSQLDLNKWYGCIYYNIVKKTHGDKDIYVMLGWDGNNLFSKKKILDVLSFENGTPKLGLPIVQMKREGQGTRYYHRAIFEYKSNATVTVNYDEELGMFIWDHLVPEDGKAFGIYATYIPDGTYEALQFEKGKLKYVEKVFHQTQDEPPIPRPLFEDKGDIPVQLPKN